MAPGPFIDPQTLQIPIRTQNRFNIQKKRSIESLLCSDYVYEHTKRNSPGNAVLASQQRQGPQNGVNTQTARFCGITAPRCAKTDQKPLPSTAFVAYFCVPHISNSLQLISQDFGEQTYRTGVPMRTVSLKLMLTITRTKLCKCLR